MERKATSVSSTLSNLFPTKLSAFIFAAYVTLFVNQGKRPKVASSKLVLIDVSRS